MKTSSMNPSLLLVKYRYWIAVAIVLLIALMVSTKSAEAACPAQPSTYGSATYTVNVPQAGTYRVWSRIMAPNTTANSYILEITDATETNNITCGNVIGDSTITANSWTWVDYKSATSTNKMNATFASAGQYKVKMIGREADVKLDRVILTADTSCAPDNVAKNIGGVNYYGENCANPPDTTPPTVSVSAPANNTTVSGPTTIRANATDDVAISKVEFYVDNVLRNTGGDTTSPYEITFDMSTLTPGSHQIYARAYDTSSTGNPISSTVITVTVADSVNPTATVTKPAAGATLVGTTNVTANASDNVGVTKVEFIIDGVVKATDTVAPYDQSLDTTTLTNASHSIVAKAYDAAGRTGSSTAVAFTVDNPVTPPPNTPPVVSVTNPTAGLATSGTIALSASATDNGTVTKVEFYIDNVLKASVTQAPFTASFNTATIAKGSHIVTAKAYDNGGLSTTSAGVSFTVNNDVILPEDINQDGKVDIADFSLLNGKFGQTGTTLGRADINQDGKVDIADFSLLNGKFGTGN